MLVRIVTALSLLAPLSAQLIYSNGPFLNFPSGGGGVPIANAVSVLQAATLAHNVFGYGAQAAVPNRLVDNFTVNTAMVIDGIEVFGYLTGGAAPSATDVRISIWTIDPMIGGGTQLLPGAGNAVNLFTVGAPYAVTNTLTNIWRVLDGPPSPVAVPWAANRNVQSIRVNFTSAPLVLTTGEYWIEFSYTGVNFTPPLATLGVVNTGNAKQFTNASLVYTAILNGTTATAGLPFNFYGTAGTPGSITNLGGGCSAAGITVDGAPTVGGYVRATLSNVPLGGFGGFLVSVTDPAFPLGVLFPPCACILHANPDVLDINTTFEIQTPRTGTLSGVAFYIQGINLDLIPVGGITTCNIAGIGMDFTDGDRIQLNTN